MEKIISFINNISLKSIIDFILNPEIAWLFYVKVVFIIISIILLIAFIWLLFISSWLRRRIGEDLAEFITYKPLGVKRTPKEWIKIVKRLELEKENEYKLSVIEADGLLEEKLKRMGKKGDTLIDLLEKIDSTILSNIEEVKQAHEIRNKIVHSPDYHLTLDEAKKIIEIYGRAFRELKIF